MRIARIVILCCAALLPCIPASLFAQENSPAWIARQKAFILNLFERKNYFDSIAETRRLLQYDPAARDNGDYRYFIEANYYLGGQYATVLANVAATGEHERETRYRYLLSQACLQLRLFSRGSEILTGIDYPLLPQGDRWMLLVRRSELFLAAGEYRRIVDEIDRTREYFPGNGERDAFERDARKYRELPLRSVGGAIALSVFIPGAGQMYAGKYWQGVLGFLSVALTATGAYFAYTYHQREVAWTLVAFSGLFYAGNIYGAYNAARSANTAINERFRNGFREAHIPAYTPLDSLDAAGLLR